MRDAFKVLTSILFVAIVVQVALAGYGAFSAVDKAKDNGSVTKDAVEHGFNAHAVLGLIILALMILLVLAALARGLGRTWLQWTIGLLVLGILQMVFAPIGTAVPALSFLHSVNALAIYAASALLAHRAWTRGVAPDIAPA
jgi:hypothetical protein